MDILDSVTTDTAATDTPVADTDISPRVLPSVEPSPRYRVVSEERVMSADEVASFFDAMRNQVRSDMIRISDSTYLKVYAQTDKFNPTHILLYEFNAEATKHYESLTLGLTDLKDPLPDIHLYEDGHLQIVWRAGWASNGTEIYHTVSLSAEQFNSVMGARRDYVIGTAAEDRIDVSAGGLNAGDYVDGRGGENTLKMIGSGELDITLPEVFVDIDRIVLSGGDDTLVVSAERLIGVNTLDGGAGTDTLRLANAGLFDLRSRSVSGFEKIMGSGGDDIIGTGDNGDVVDGGLGNDIIDGAGGDDSLAGGGGDDELRGGAGRDKLYGGGDNDVLDGGDNGDELYGEAGADRMTGGGGNDALYGGGDNDLLDGGGDIDLLYGEAGDDSIAGGAGADTLEGGIGNDLLDGGADADMMKGGTGNDIYVVDSGSDAVTENADEGQDTVRASVDYRLGANLENLIMEGLLSRTGAGNSLDNRLVANDAGNLLFGLEGDDELVGGRGADTLDGGTGADIMQGGGGDDTYIVDNIRDIIDESGDWGRNDTIRAAIDIDLKARTIIGLVENVVLEGAAGLKATGNDFDNNLTGNSGANRLDGGNGADRMQGGFGNDTYVVDSLGDSVDETGFGGIDTVEATVDVDLLEGDFRGDIENITLLYAADVNAYGNALENLLVGNGGANILDGRGGADLMRGGAGNDTYFIDNAGDRVEDTAGIDEVRTSISLDLSSTQIVGSVEKLFLLGNSAINGFGNALGNSIEGNGASNTLSGVAGNDVLYGKGGNDVLNGGAGDDIMFGDAGSDTYYVDSVSDAVKENGVSVSADVDTVYAYVSYGIVGDAAGVENLVLLGSALNTTGNDLNNSLTGNGYANSLNGGLGADVMSGGAGNDTYYVDNARDTINELVNAGSGVDTVYSSISFNLAASTVTGALENLVLTGNQAVRGDGTAAANLLRGNSIYNQLYGWAGDDVIDGDDGFDTLTGGTGRDTFVFSTNISKYDKITDFSVVDDTIRLDLRVFGALSQAPGVLNSASFTVSTVSAAADAGDRIIYDRDSGNLYYDSNGTGAGGLTLFAQIGPGLALTAADFYVV